MDITLLAHQQTHQHGSYVLFELQGMDRTTRKLLTIYGAFHPKSDVDRLYLPRAMGGRGLISCEGCVTSEENNLGWYIKHSTESLLVQGRNRKIVDAASSVDKTEYKKKQDKSR